MAATKSKSKPRKPLSMNQVAARLTENTNFLARDGCFEWTGTPHGTRLGYGAFRMGGRGTYNNGVVQMAHRASFVVHFGDVPKGFHIHHICENKACINPMHLEALSRHDHGRISARQRWDRTKQGEEANG